MLQTLCCLGVASKGASEIASPIIHQGSRNKAIHPVFIFKTVTKTKSSLFPSLCLPGSPSFWSNAQGFWIKKGRSRVSNNELMASDPECVSMIRLCWCGHVDMPFHKVSHIGLSRSFKDSVVTWRHVFFCIVGSLRIGMASGILSVCFLSFFLFF